MIILENFQIFPFNYDALGIIHLSPDVNLRDLNKSEINVINNCEI